MKRVTLSAILSTFLVLGIASHAGAQTQNKAPLTNASIVKLVKAGFKEKTVISIIGSRAVNFDLSTEGLIELKRNNVSEKIILAMLGQQQGMMIDDDDIMDLGSDDSFRSNFPGKNPGPGTGNSTDIFGNNGGSRGETKTRGGNGNSSGDTITTGSATVRILRPPAEAGAPPKLDKAPTLNNDSIVELVAAGFSDGTIIRRIEQSPVDFDLSPDKLSELRKRRVSDRVLTAMKLAMGDSGDTKTPPATNGTQKQSN